LLTDDHTLFRQGIKTLIAAESDMEVVGEGRPMAPTRFTRAAETRPDIVLMDIGMTGPEQLRGHAPDQEKIGQRRKFSS